MTGVKKTFDSASGTLGHLILRSAGVGVIGFIIFFFLIFFLKSVQMAFGITSIFKMDIYDVLISLTGFVMMFLISFLKHFTKED